jgi:hypothetical protein
MHDSWVGSLPIGSTAGRGKRREEEKKRRREEEKKRRREEEKKREMSNGQSNGWSNRLCNTRDGSLGKCRVSSSKSAPGTGEGSSSVRDRIRAQAVCVMQSGLKQCA